MGEAKLRREKPMISVLIPERGRPGGLRRLIRSLVDTAGDDQRWEAYIAIDEDDETHSADEPPFRHNVHVFRWPRPLTLGQKVNQLALEAKGDILWFCANDRVMETDGWPAKFREAVANLPNGIGVAYPKDDFHPDHAAFPIITRQMERAVGFVMPPCYPYWFIDTHWDQLGVLLGVRFEIDVKLGAPDGQGDTTGGRYELPFWCDFFHALNPVRLKEGIQLIEAAWGKEGDEGKRALADLPRRQQIAAARIAHLKHPAFLERWAALAGAEPPYAAYAEVKAHAVKMMADLAKQQPRKLRVAIATPSGRTYEATTANCIAALASYTSLAGLDCTLLNVQTSSVTHGRNSIVQIALEQNCDYVFWLDSDMVVPPDTIVKFLRHNKDIVGATYNRRTKPYSTLGRLKGPPPPPEELAKGGLVEAELLPGGVLLVRADIYRRLGWPWYAECYRWAGKDNLDAFKNQMREYFTKVPPDDVLASIDATPFGAWLMDNYEVAVDSGSPERYFSEDLFMIVKAREAGFTAWCDLDVTYATTHLGVMEVTCDRPTAANVEMPATPFAPSEPPAGDCRLQATAECRSARQRGARC